MLSLKMLRKLIPAVALLLVATSCSAGTGSDTTVSEAVSTTGSGTSSATTAAQADPGEIKEGGTLTIAIEVDLRELNHLNSRSTVDKTVMGSTVYDSLFQTDQNGNSVPALATEATPSEDGLVWTFKLREGVLFHNGKEFTAQDVIDNFDAFMDPANASTLAGDIENVASVEMTGDFEVQFTLHSKDRNLPATFTDIFFMADWDAEKSDPEVYVGTGPYQWSERVPGDRFTFVRFDDHWRGRPPLDQVIFKVIPDPQVAVLELQGGGVDMILNYVPPEAIPDLRNNPDVQLYSVPGSTVYGALLNHEKARQGGYPDADAFRRGMAYLWNSEELVPPIIGEFGAVADDLIPPWQLGHDESREPWQYDPDKGMELLAEAGFEPGDTISLIAMERPFLCSEATAFQSQLVELGYDATLECLEADIGVLRAADKDFDLFWTRLSGRTAAGTFFNDRFRSSLSDLPDDFWTLESNVVDELIDQALAAASDEEYEALVQELTRTVLDEEIAYLPLYFDSTWVAANPRVHGIALSPTVWYGMLMNQMTTVWVDPK